MSVWINGRRATLIDCHDRGLQYGDGIFETMRVRRRGIRLLEYHLERLYHGCRTLQIAAPSPKLLRRELGAIAAEKSEGILKLILTRGKGARGYRPTGRERCTRIATLYPLARATRAQESSASQVRVCATRLGRNPRLAGLKSLNRLECVLARAEWNDVRIWEGLMRDSDGNWVCGTMSNLFLRRGQVLMTPRLDQCGVAGVMRRWILKSAAQLDLRTVERRIAWPDLAAAEEVFMSNAIVGIRSIRTIDWPNQRNLRGLSRLAADRLRALLEME